MKRFFSLLFLICGFMHSAAGASASSMPRFASGSGTIFFPVGSSKFTFSSKPIYELTDERLHDYFESNHKDKAYLIGIDPFLYQQVQFYSYWLGPKESVLIEFEGYGNVAFTYIPELEMTLGRMEIDGVEEMVVLQARSRALNPIQEAKGKNCDDEESLFPND